MTKLTDKQELVADKDLWDFDITEDFRLEDDLWQIGDNEYDPGKDEDGNFKMSDKLLKRFVKKTYQVIDKVQQIGLPSPGEQLRLITTQAFNSIAIIKLVAESEIIKSAKLIIFAINQSAAKILIQLQEQGKLNNTTLVISSLRNAGIKDKSKAVELLKEYFEIIFITSHAKIAVLETEKGNYYNIEGSGNFSFNARLEQYVIDNDIGLFNFSNEWIECIKNWKANNNELATNA